MSKGPTFPLYVRVPQKIHARLIAAATEHGWKVRGRIQHLVVAALDKELPPLPPAGETPKRRRAARRDD